MTEACEVFRRIFSLTGGSGTGIGIAEGIGMIGRTGLLAGLPVILRQQENEKKRYYRNAVLILLIVAGMLMNFRSGGDSSFIYFQF